MKIAKIEAIPVRIAYRVPELSSLVARSGVADVLVKVTSDDGLIGWGECTRAADVPGIEAAVNAMAPLVLNRDPWSKEAIRHDVMIAGGWQFQAFTANFAFAGIDMALWDLTGKAAHQPLYRLFGGAVRDEVDYFYYLHWASPDDMALQGRDGAAKGYDVFYLKVGVDERAEEEMLAALRAAIGPDRRIRLDANQAWTVPQAVRLLNRWHDLFTLDFIEAPVSVDPVEAMLEVKQRTPVPVCANEGLWRDVDALRVIKSRCCDYLCYSSYWVGSLARFHALNTIAHLEGLRIVKHTHGELGLAAACGQHMMLAAEGADIGHQQTAQMMVDDILTETVPIATGPRWGRIEGPGLGVTVDEEKVARYHDDYRRMGAHPIYGDRFPLTP